MVRLPPDHALQSAILVTGGWSEARVVCPHSGTGGVYVERCIHLAVGDQEAGGGGYSDEPEQWPTATQGELSNR